MLNEAMIEAGLDCAHHVGLMAERGEIEAIYLAMKAKETVLAVDVVERAAKTIFVMTAAQIGKASDYEALPEGSKEKVREVARAALDGLREALIDIHNRILCPVGPSPTLDEVGRIASAALTSLEIKAPVEGEGL